MNKASNIRSVMNKGHYLFWASYFWGASLSCIQGETPKESEIILPSPAVAAAKEKEMLKGAESEVQKAIAATLPSPTPVIMPTKGEETKAISPATSLSSSTSANEEKSNQESQAKSVPEGSKVAVDNKVAADEPVACVKLSGLQDFFANQKLWEAFDLNNAMINILLQSIIPPIGQNCSALKMGSNVGLFFLTNPKGTNAKENFFYCIVFQEEGNAFEEYLKKKQIFFQKEGGAIILPEPGNTLESFGKDCPKKLVALAEQPSQSGVIEVNAKWWNVAQAMGWRNPGGD
ncbi:MAG: hypothetical protein LBJ81_02765, partial [Puniceicoccales bacterium]|nr:hypothetical protein [Puniceicoccales bacterium]